MKGLENISATQIGTKARHLLAGESEAKVWGITSRGLFIHLESGWVIYLSPEEIPGPLTLNLESGNSLVDLASGGDMVRVSSQRIDFPRTKMHVNTAHAVPWEAPPPLEISIDLDKCRHRIMDVSRRAIELLNEAGRTPSALFQSYLALSGMGEPTRSSDGPWSPLLIDLVNARREESARRVAICLEAFLGVGHGLTPSGDDLVIGFFLSLNRWGAKFIPKMEIDSIYQIIISAAYAKTTTLSANLIECAAEGQADERLILALDGIMHGMIDIQRCVTWLTSWGNTSGLDALVGMGMAIG